jgi:hypothetical protein
VPISITTLRIVRVAKRDPTINSWCRVNHAVLCSCRSFPAETESDPSPIDVAFRFPRSSHVGIKARARRGGNFVHSNISHSGLLGWLVSRLCRERVKLGTRNPCKCQVLDLSQVRLALEGHGLSFQVRPVHASAYSASR